MSNVISDAHKEGKWETGDYTLAGNTKAANKHYTNAVEGRSYYHQQAYSYLAGAGYAALALPASVMKTIWAGLQYLSGHSKDNIKPEAAKLYKCAEIAVKGTVFGLVSLVESVADLYLYKVRADDKKQNPDGHAALLLIDVQKGFIANSMPKATTPLPVPNAKDIIPVANRLLNENIFKTKVSCQDFHPANHGSFAVNLGVKEHTMSQLMGIPQYGWPVHCVEDALETGVEFHNDLETSKVDRNFKKGRDQLFDSYGAFCDNTIDGEIDPERKTLMDEYLKSKNIKRVYAGGLATDFCVLYSVQQARKLGYEVFFLMDASRGMGFAQFEKNADGTDNKEKPIMIDKCPITGEDFEKPIQKTSLHIAYEKMKEAGIHIINSEKIPEIEAQYNKILKLS